MSKLKDPYDYIEWNPDRDRSMSFVLDHKEEKIWRRKRTPRMGEQWIGHVYDLIALLTLAAVIVTLFRLLLN